MCLIRDTAKAVIEQLVKDKEEFTAYDVTEEVRSRLPNTTVYHYKLRDYIHNVLQVQIDDGLYTKEQDFNKHPNGPFVYTPVGNLTPNLSDPHINLSLPVTCKTSATLGDFAQNLTKTHIKWVKYGFKPQHSTQPGRKFWNVRDNKGRFVKQPPKKKHKIK